MQDISLTRVSKVHVGDLQRIGKVTFYETFAQYNTDANMKSYLEEAFSIEKLSGELDNERSQFFFAILDSNVIGYLKLNFGESNDLEIERIYVLKEYHGKGVGQLLYEKAIEIAKLANSDFAWLGVWEQNPRAIRFYEKNGFVPYDKHIFKLGDDDQSDILMKLQLNNQV